MKQDGTVWAWGSNTYGQLGDGTHTSRSAPVQVAGLSGVVAVNAAGSYNTFALKGDGTVWAWGGNGGLLGDGTTTDRSTPVPVTGLTGVTAIAARGRHTLALKQDGTVWAWGDNFYGELGEGTDIYNRRTPVPVAGLSGVVGIAAGKYFSIALKQDGTVWAWGYNGNGQLGDGTLTSRSTPAPVPGMTGAGAIAGGEGHSVAVTQYGTVWAWGAIGSASLAMALQLIAARPCR